MFGIEYLRIMLKCSKYLLLLFYNHKAVSNSSSTIHKRNHWWQPVDGSEIQCIANKLVITY